MVERPGIPSLRATSTRCFFDAFASTPSADLPFGLGPPLRARESDGPFLALGSQWSPTFSKLCLSASYATRCARSPSPYCLAAESCALANVRCALAGDLRSVLGSSRLLAAPLFDVFGIRGAPPSQACWQPPKPASRAHVPLS